MAFVRQAESSEVDAKLTRAVRRIHEVYGTDLKRFFEDARRAASEQSDKALSGEVEHVDSDDQEP